MKKILFSALLLTVLATSSAQAREERWPQWYVGLTGSLVLLSDSDISGSGLSGDSSYNSGYGISGSIGYRPNMDIAVFNNMRFEIEAAYRANDVDNITGVAFASTGEAKSMAYMINAIYDVETGSQLVPYFGAGIGYSNIEFRDDDDMVFSYQFLAGVGYEPELIPNTIWSIGYRYFGTQDPSLSSGATSYEIEYDAHNFEAGLQMRF